MGPETGGLVRDGCLVCPFHGYEFDTSGECVATPYAPPPKATRLRVYPTREVQDIVFAWWGIDGRPPHWELPESPEASADWDTQSYQIIPFAGHPQETSENAVDLAHLRYVHGYDSVSRTEPLTIKGAYLYSGFRFSTARQIVGPFSFNLDLLAKIHVYGLGFSFVEVYEESMDMRFRMWVLATPVDGTNVDMVLVTQMCSMRKPKRFFGGLKFLPPALRHRALHPIIRFMQKKDVMQDVVIWKRKQYVEQPRLCRSDGEIGRFRRYCRQFYPQESVAAAERSP